METKKTYKSLHSLSFAVAELCLNQKVFQQARTVVDLAWESLGGINTQILKELAYIRAIIKETLRLYSVGSGSTAMEAERDVVIEGQLNSPWDESKLVGAGCWTRFRSLSEERRIFAGALVGQEYH